jgi:DNA-binding MarR family transcriptional regulator
MNYMDRLSKDSSRLMTMTGFFHGIIRLAPVAASAHKEAKPYIVRYHILKCLERGCLHPSDISSALNVKKNTLSELLDRMARDGLVRRGADPDDRRKIALRITETGRSTSRTYEKNLIANMRHFLDGLEEDDRRDLIQAMESVARILERNDKRSGKHFPL